MRKVSIRVRYISLLALLLVAAHSIFFIILCGVEFHEVLLDPSMLAESASEILFFFLVGVISLPLSLLVAWRVTRSLLTPLQGMTQVAERISGGDFAERIELTGTFDELDRLARTFNSAFDRYEGVVGRLKTFNADVAHQLRTPLAAIQSTCEVTLLNQRERPAYETALQHVLEEVHGLSGSIDQLLLLARLDSEKMRNTFVEIGLHDLVQRSAERFGPLLAAKNISLQLRLGPDVLFQGAPILLEQALNNLMDNAIRFTPDRGSLWLDTFEEGGRVCCAVEDSGPGLSPDLQRVLFKRFQCDESLGGVGLGLSIAHGIIEAHGGTLRVEPAQRAQGARFVFELSCNASD